MHPFGLWKAPGRIIAGVLPAVLAAGLLTTAASTAHAQTPGRDDFNAGVQAARQGDHRGAVEHFMQALESGLDTAALHYNLGVSFYKTGRMEQARDAFLNAARKPAMAAPGYYQLGRIAREQGRPTEAREWFGKARDRARTDKMRRLARRALGEIERPAARRWLLWTEFGAGHDDNALLVPPDLSSASDEADTFYDATLYGYYDFRDRDRQPGLRLHALMTTQRYADLDSFDYTATEAGLSYPFGGPDWTTRLGLAARSSDFGGNAYQDTTRATIRMDGKLNPAWRLKSRLSYESLDPAAVYAFLEGEKTALTVEFHHRGGVKLLYGFETNDRDDLFNTSTGEFRSFSPTRNRLGLAYEHTFNRQWALRLGTALRQSRYADPDRREDGTTFKREADRLQTEIGLAWTMPNQWRLEARAEHTDNDSNYDGYDYDRTMITLNLNKAFSDY
jgi:hypothetical protein